MNYKLKLILSFLLKTMFSSMLKLKVKKNIFEVQYKHIHYFQIMWLSESYHHKTSNIIMLCIIYV